MITDEVFLKNVRFVNTNSLFLEDHREKLIIGRTMSNKAQFLLSDTPFCLSVLDAESCD